MGLSTSPWWRQGEDGRRPCCFRSAPGDDEAGGTVGDIAWGRASHTWRQAMDWRCHHKECQHARQQQCGHHVIRTNVHTSWLQHTGAQTGQLHRVTHARTMAASRLASKRPGDPTLGRNRGREGQEGSSLCRRLSWPPLPETVLNTLLPKLPNGYMSNVFFFLTFLTCKMGK